MIAPRDGEYDIAPIEFAAMQSVLFGDFDALQIWFFHCDFDGAACGPSARAQAGGEVNGTWLTQAGDAKVRVSKCGGGICGVVVWLKDPINPATGKPQIDDKNPNPSLTKRPMIGLPLFMGMRPSGANKWSGQIYNADDGNSYASNIAVSGPDRLRVEGCVGALCGGETWTRTAR